MRDTRIVSMSEFSEWLHSRPICPVAAILFVGDRFSCCDEAVLIEENGCVYGAATIAPQGEQGSNGTPAIVGLYVVPGARGLGYGTELMRATVERCRERGFTRVHVDAMSTGTKKAIARLPEDLRAMLEVKDLGNVLDRF
ncbi:MAG: GNAT family N-acetyltransferase [Patescibacteria group bacterium]